MAELHSLLRRQLRRHLGAVREAPLGWHGVLEAVNEAYWQADEDRGMLERSLELSSQELLQANSEMRAVFQAIPDLLFRLDADGRILDCKAGATDDLYLPAAELIGRRIQDVPPREVGARFAAAILEVGKSGAMTSMEYSLLRDGRRSHYEARLRPLRGRQMIALVRNITSRKLIEEAHQESLSLLRATLESTADGILVVDLEGRVVTRNRKFAEMWRIPDELLASRDDSRLLNYAVSQLEHPEAFLARVRELYAQPDASSHETIEFKDGRVFARYSQPQRISEASVGRVFSFRDVTQERRTEAAIRHRAYHDDLTGLPNRQLFRDRFAQALGQARRFKHTLAMLFLDLDRFKTINDTLGHAVGDKLLEGVAERLLSRTREGDTLARLGGDEFMLLAAQVRHAEDAARIAENLLSALRPPFLIDRHELHVTASVGISLFPFDGNDAETLVKHADIALYRAKERGRDAYEIYAPAMSAMAVERLALENSLRHALQRDEFLLNYQPLVHVGRGAIVGGEALARWRRADGSLVPPADFIPLAEDTGLIGSLGDFVLRGACAQGGAWRALGLPALRVAVNLSPSQFQRATLVSDVARCLEETGFDPGCLELELTEGTIMRYTEQGIASLRELRAMGVGIAVDDFGTGYSSLSYLKRLPISALKIDGSFVRDALQDADSAAIVTAIISMARSLRLRVVAEGVESALQVEFLRSRGCEEMQGFFFSGPLPAQDFADLVGAPPRWLACGSGSPLPGASTAEAR
jgi:diguanylate cyclase (GGDEF)-like protein/PAS domain S-box-containing protein